MAAAKASTKKAPAKKAAPVVKVPYRKAKNSPAVPVKLTSESEVVKFEEPITDSLLQRIVKDILQESGMLTPIPAPIVDFKNLSPDPMPTLAMDKKETILEVKLRHMMDFSDQYAGNIARLNRIYAKLTGSPVLDVVSAPKLDPGNILESFAYVIDYNYVMIAQLRETIIKLEEAL